MKPSDLHISHETSSDLSILFVVKSKF